MRSHSRLLLRATHYDARRNHIARIDVECERCGRSLAIGRDGIMRPDVDCSRDGGALADSVTGSSVVGV